MNTQNKKPNIRFNQFKELWKVVKLDSISQKVKSKNINNSFENVLTNSAEFGIVPQRDFFDKDIANLKSLSGYYVVQPNDFVYNPRISNKAPVGPIKANFLNITGVISPLYYVFRTQNIDVFFLAKYFDSSYWHKFMKLNGDTGARSDRFAIKDSVFKEMPIPFPSLAEQSAISTFFRNLDDLLSSYKDNLANYQSLKATMLSKMFPKPGQSFPEIRIDEFEGKWEKYHLGDIFEQISNYIEPSVENELWSLTVEKGLTPKTERYKRDFLVKKNDKFKKVDLNEFVYNPMNLTLGALDLNNNDVTISISGYYVVMKNIDVEKFNNDFLKILLKTTYAIYQYKQFATGTLIEKQRVQFPTFSEIPFYLPTIAEQQAIGAYFSNLDNLINSYQEKISQLETFKKKLLQDMFI